MSEPNPARPATATAAPAVEGGGLRRAIRVRDGLAITVGMVIGAGILRTPGLIAAYLGDPATILGVWVLGGVVAGLSTLLLAEMAAAIPSAGGKYVYARHAWGPLAGFVAGWAELLVVRAFSGAAKAVVIAEYVTLLAGRGSVPIIAGAVVAGFAVLHLGGLRVGTTVQNVTTVIKVLVLLGIAAAGVWAGGSRGFAAGGAPAPEYAGLLGFALAYQAVAFAYYGWEDAAKMAEETREPGRSLPRILLGGAALVALIYLLLNVSFLSALTPAEMAGSPLVAQDAIADVFGTAAGTVVVAAGILILLSSLNVNFLGMPRVALALGRDRLAPRAFGRVSANGTPLAGLVFISVLLLGLAVSGAFEWLIRFMMLVAITVDLMVLLGFFALRRRRPDLHRPLRVPGYPWLPALTVALYVLVLVIIVATQPALAVGGAALLGAIIAAGLVVMRRAETAPTPRW